jgi:hypothetical protein
MEINSAFKGLIDVYVWLNMFRVPLRPSSGEYNCTRSLWFYRWIEKTKPLLVLVWQVNLSDHAQLFNRHAPAVKPDAPSAFVRSW